jgi:hypothetical protein
MKWRVNNFFKSVLYFEMIYQNDLLQGQICIVSIVLYVSDIIKYKVKT